MKVIGISMGRVNGNSELLLKHALKVIEEAGNEVTFIRLHDYYIKPCVGCELCTFMIRQGVEPHCKYGWDEDDIKPLMDEVKSAQGLILAAPAYHLMPPGIGTVLLNRIHSCGCDNHTGRKNEDNSNYRKVCATIGVGGSDWTSLQMPILNLIATELIGSQMNLVDQMCVHRCPSVSMVALLQDALDRACQLGENVVRALNNIENPRYFGDAAETCPICHSNLIRFKEGRAECPVCAVSGDVVMENGRFVKIDWDGSIEMSRWSQKGTQHHDEEVNKNVKEAASGKYAITDDQKKKIREAVQTWGAYLEPLMPPKRGKERRE